LLVMWSVWEVAGHQGGQIARIFPPPSIFLTELTRTDFRIGIGAQAATIPGSIVASLVRVLSGLALGLVVALGASFFITGNRWVRRFTLPVIQVFAPIAPIAWIPLALVLFGIGIQTAVFIVFMGTFFTLTLGIVQAIEDVPSNLIHSARTLGARRFEVRAFVVLPAILPSVVTILRLNFVAAWMAVLAAEMTGLRDGLGAVINIGRNLFNGNLIVLGICLIGVIGFVVDLGLRWAQRRFFWWGDKT
jgi:ABC-type nitrate/sulfonate/bicarbonate transport system permease component